MSALLAAVKNLKKGKGDAEQPAGPQAKDFNLDEIFMAETDRFHKLKEVIKFIFDSLELNKSEVNKVDIKLQQKFMEISK